MLKELYKKNKFLCKLFITLLVILIVWLGVAIISAIQTYINEKDTITVIVNPYTEKEDEVTAFDVTNLTEEEIAEYLEYYRNQKGGQQ